MSMETYYKNYLSHHGIKGQKWGVRRFQNEDGSYKSGAEGRYDDSVGSAGSTGSFLSKRKEKKASKKEEKEFKNRMYNESTKVSNEYDESDEGKKKLKRYSDAIDNLMTEDGWDDEDPRYKEFDVAEDDYLRNQGRYTANKLIEKHGEQTFRKFMKSEGNRAAYEKKVEELIEDYADSHRWIHGF